MPKPSLCQQRYLLRDINFPGSNQNKTKISKHLRGNNVTFYEQKPQNSRSTGWETLSYIMWRHRISLSSGDECKKSVANWKESAVTSEVRGAILMRYHTVVIIGADQTNFYRRSAYLCILCIIQSLFFSRWRKSSLRIGQSQYAAWKSVSLSESCFRYELMRNMFAPAGLMRTAIVRDKTPFKSVYSE
jgi:hypothetical protein